MSNTTMRKCLYLYTMMICKNTDHENEKNRGKQNKQGTCREKKDEEGIAESDSSDTNCHFEFVEREREEKG